MPSFCRIFCALLVLCCLISTVLGRQLSNSDLGCYFDYNNSVRDLTGIKFLGFTKIADVNVTQMNNTVDYANVKSPNMTYELCGRICALGAFRYMGLQAHEWCCCSNSYGMHGAAPSGQCSASCSGNSSQNCGGPFRNRVFQLTYTNENHFVLGNRELVAVTNSDAVSFSTVGSTRLSECLYQCNVGCQAVIFNGQQRLCHLLEYAVVPAALSSASSGDFFVRG